MGQKQRDWSVTTQPGQGFVAWRAGHALPRTWSTTIDAEHLPYVVELGFTADEGTGPRCVALNLASRDNGEPVTARRLRGVPIGECIQLAIASAAAREERRTDEVVFHLGSPDIEENLEHTTPRMSREHLKAVADVYRAAPKQPTLAVEQAFAPVPRSTVSRWIRRARDLGLIEDTTHGRQAAGKEQ